jgi:2-polyprenyl-3-methyl-5-hydroxy-6-metoxy-1,4-benzoquinol methylase
MSDAASTPVLAGGPGALARLESRFALERAEVRLGGMTLWLPELADPLAYIDARLAGGSGGGEDLPYWTKVWPASLALALLAASLKLDPAQPVLELGAGLGLPGLVLAARGHRVVLTDLDPDALEFARAAAELNGLEDKVSARALDWTAPPADLGPFATVLGAEILYQPRLYPGLVDLLQTLLAPGGRAYLSHQERPFLISFFAMARARFTIGRQERTLRGEDGPTKVFLYALHKD